MPLLYAEAEETMTKAAKAVLFRGKHTKNSRELLSAAFCKTEIGKGETLGASAAPVTLT